MSDLALEIFDRFFARSGFAGSYHWTSLEKGTASEVSAAATGRADLIEKVTAGDLDVARALKIAKRRSRP